MRILLIDDEPFIVRALTRILGRAHEVKGAITYEAALTALADPAWQPELIITDYDLDDGNTAEDLPLGRIPYIVCSGRGQAVPPGLAVRARGVLAKPYTLADLRPYLEVGP